MVRILMVYRHTYIFLLHACIIASYTNMQLTRRLLILCKSPKRGIAIRIKWQQAIKQNFRPVARGGLRDSEEPPILARFLLALITLI